MQVTQRLPQQPTAQEAGRLGVGELLGGVPRQGTPVHVRVLHVVESRDGLTCRETVRPDAGTVIAQLSS